MIHDDLHSLISQSISSFDVFRWLLPGMNTVVPQEISIAQR